MYAIRKTRHFFGQHTEKSYVVDGFAGEKRAEFATRAEAQSIVDLLDATRYNLAHNECARPEYRVTRIRS